MSKGPHGATPEAGTLAFTFVGLTLVFTGFGHLVDRWLQSGPWSMVTGVFVGAGLGFLYLVSIPFGRSAGRLGSEDGRDRDEGSQGRSS